MSTPEMAESRVGRGALLLLPKRRFILGCFGGELFEWELVLRVVICGWFGRKSARGVWRSSEAMIETMGR